ncbi:MAG: 2-succinyl-5-enolpyruvyl-6-hydroxy-3-cyclohexene-1-carboxylic-acid synthase [Reichenbachiella sp.]|uniref:2-succinyl-5-enolpyruvyl-6-hydroxy-3- cyclohexene-1-carboxylic-acid synthase n=1 Tax=Reichenbachiella sp. TaxID=2184521 RepID=UPI0032649929
MNLQPIYDLAQICSLHGIRYAVISPGSRNAALTIAFARHPKIECYSVSDERSAAFIALGLSLKTGLPTALICTSGSAGLNYAPAVAEAYFNQVPLLVLTADRPPEWIGERDGQTIYQENLYGRHVKKSFVFPSLSIDKDSVATGHDMVHEAVLLTQSNNKGPVHINVPFREPFYPESGTVYDFNQNLVKTDPPNGLNPIPELGKMMTELPKYKRVLLIVGQGAKQKSLNDLLEGLSTQHQIPIVADIISNVHEVAGVITGQDLFLKANENKELQPDLLITIGMSVISKNLKIFVRNHKPKAHWHVRDEAHAPDTYKALTLAIQSDPESFLLHLSANLSVDQSQQEFFHAWQKTDQSAKEIIRNYESEQFSDYQGYKKVLQSLPNNIDLHLANSMAVRYANVIGLRQDQKVEVYCNRGTSGIDGSNSTAVGATLASPKPVVLLTGDVAFFYDINAFWHNSLSDNLKIIIFNNQGGGIFRMIDGPSQQPELEEFFETVQKRNAKLTAQEYHFEYMTSHDTNDLTQTLPLFFEGGGRKILEIFTNPQESKEVYKDLFHKLSK